MQLTLYKEDYTYIGWKEILEGLNLKEDEVYQVPTVTIEISQILHYKYIKREGFKY